MRLSPASPPRFARSRGPNPAAQVGRDLLGWNGRCGLAGSCELMLHRGPIELDAAGSSRDTDRCDRHTEFPSDDHVSRLMQPERSFLIKHVELSRVEPGGK
jgi:hypothetical protein